MAGAVVPDQDESPAEIDGMKLREAAADAQAVLDEHGDAGFQFRLAAHGEARGREQRIAHDEIGDKPAHGAVRLRFVKVGKPVQLIFIDEPLERHGDASRHIEILAGQLTGDGIGLGIGGLENLQNLPLLSFCIGAAPLAGKREPASSPQPGSPLTSHIYALATIIGSVIGRSQRGLLAGLRDAIMELEDLRHAHTCGTAYRQFVCLSGSGRHLSWDAS